MDLDGTFYQLVVVAHVLSAIAFLGPTFVLVAYDKLGEKNGGEVHVAVRGINQLLAERWSGPGAGAVGLLGVALVLSNDELEFGDTWVSLSVAADVALVVLALAVMAPLQRRITAVLKETGTAAAVRRAELKARHKRLEARVVVVGGAMHLLVAGMLALMIFKP